MDSEGSGNSDVPVIIPGDPKHIQKTLLKDPKVQEFIQNQVAENRDAVQANDASAIVLNTFQSHSGENSAFFNQLSSYFRTRADL